MKTIKWLLGVLLVAVSTYLYNNQSPKTTTTEEQTEQALAQRLELPRLSEKSTDRFVTHRLSDGSINYSLEYDSERRHARWVAFTFDRHNSLKRAERTDAWAGDPELIETWEVGDLFRNSRYTRGHLVASEDRVASVEANAQTFYYSNISPQLYAHNAGIWERLERKVRSWGRNNRFRDTLFVVKGGTITDGQIEQERLGGLIVVPKYYWMALLSVKDGQYHSIAFLTERRPYKGAEGNLQSLAVSVDELERFTGLDFFVALPDDLEAQVEREAPLGDASRQYWWSH